MSREWVQFWSAQAVMAVALASAMYAGAGLPWEIGSLAEWMAGLATFAAVVVALKVSQDQGKLAITVAESERMEREERERHREGRHIKYLLQLLCNAELIYSDLIEDHEIISKEFVELWIAGESNTHIDDALRAFPVYMLPGSQLMDMLFRGRMVIGSARTSLRLFASNPTDENKESFLKCLSSLDNCIRTVVKHAKLHGVKPESIDEYLVWKRLSDDEVGDA